MLAFPQREIESSGTNVDDCAVLLPRKLDPLLIDVHRHAPPSEPGEAKRFETFERRRRGLPEPHIDEQRTLELTVASREQGTLA
jgi:hypothetical protein